VIRGLVEADMSADTNEVCEVRLPTYRRLTLLKRALQSRISQTYPNWRCIVFDDCPNGTARSVVDSLCDHRIYYSHNERRLGAIGNIDQAFARMTFLRGRYAFVLEDDNFLLPKHIEKAVSILREQETKLVFCNQFCEIIGVAGQAGGVGLESLNGMYEPGIQDPNDLLPALFFSHGFSNGAAFWRTDCRSDFQMRMLTRNPGIQESFRLLRVCEPVFVSLESTSVWRPHEPLTTSKLSWLRFLSNRIRKLNALREITECRLAIIKRLGLARVVKYIETNKILDVAEYKQIRLHKIEMALLICGWNVSLTNRNLTYRLVYLLAGFLLRHLLPVSEVMRCEAAKSGSANELADLPSRGLGRH
jgi:glycosyltransferase involved in cell wall biosynthesis